MVEFLLFTNKRTALFSSVKNQTVYLGIMICKLWDIFLTNGRRSEEMNLPFTSLGSNSPCLIWTIKAVQRIMATIYSRCTCFCLCFPIAVWHKWKQPQTLHPISYLITLVLHYLTRTTSSVDLLTYSASFLCLCAAFWLSFHKYYILSYIDRRASLSTIFLTDAIFMNFFSSWNVVFQIIVLWFLWPLQKLSSEEEFFLE